MSLEPLIVALVLIVLNFFLLRHAFIRQTWNSYLTSIVGLLTSIALYLFVTGRIADFTAKGPGFEARITKAVVEKVVKSLKVLEQEHTINQVKDITGDNPPIPLTRPAEFQTDEQWKRLSSCTLAAWTLPTGEVADIQYVDDLRIDWKRGDTFVEPNLRLVLHTRGNPPADTRFVLRYFVLYLDSDECK